MADNTANEENGAAKGPWTEQEKYSFLLQVINQLAGDKSIKLSEINMPGRTTKSLTHVWAKVRADAAAASNGGGVAAAPKPAVKKPAAKKRAAPTTNDDGNSVPKPTRKRTYETKKTGAVANASAEANAEANEENV